MYKNSKCRKSSWLHKFVLFADIPEVYMEVCERCKLRVEHKKDKQGRYDQKKYLSYHARELLQPHQSMFFREYPDFGKTKILDKII